MSKVAFCSNTHKNKNIIAEDLTHKTTTANLCSLYVLSTACSFDKYQIYLTVPARKEYTHKWESMCVEGRGLCYTSISDVTQPCITKALGQQPNILSFSVGLLSGIV